MWTSQIRTNNIKLRRNWALVLEFSWVLRPHAQVDVRSKRGCWREMGLWGVHFCNVKARAAIRKAGVVFCTLDYLLLEARPLLHWYDCYCLWVFALVWLLRTERELNQVETSAAPLLHDQPFSDPFKKLSCRSDVALLHTKTPMTKLQYNREATLKCCTTNIAGSFIGATATGMCNHVETFAAPVSHLPHPAIIQG